jgi:hypothetical protein
MVKEPAAGRENPGAAYCRAVTPVVERKSQRN